MAIKTISLNNKKFDISYEIVNQGKTQDIVFLHGWGSNKDIMKQAFGKELSEYRHIYIDMPGFGKSSNDYVLGTKEYAYIIKSFLETIKSDFKIIAGHSFGGKVATLLNPQTLVLFSSAGIIEQKPLQVRFKIILAKLFNNLGLGKVTKAFRSKDVDNMSQNMYETFKNVLNEDFEEIFKSFKGTAKIFWGKNDSATSLKNGEKIASLIKNSSFKAYEGDHYFFLKHFHDISKIILG